MSYQGIELDLNANGKAVGTRALISSSKSKASVFAIPTNEELMIAQETKKLL